MRSPFKLLVGNAVRKTAMPSFGLVMNPHCAEKFALEGHALHATVVFGGQEHSKHMDNGTSGDVMKSMGSSA